ncbi:Uncharacterized protein TCAP_04351 [Tolypocladium capitatum]|uniref:Uncharacterized protein n=1 Tax=Tolypocladium capitatum TaxID=45235 RepID=A0A2K3QDU9_9HYPO|nr:Uncharacterized protein TCAP_04351 [Tolypocladium capitatum]
MFLHSGASLHGHEYSARRASSAQVPPPKRHTLLRTALRPLAPPESNSTAQAHASEELAHRGPSLDDSPRPSSLSSRDRPASGSIMKRDLSVRFREPHMDPAHTPLTSDGEELAAGSELSDCTDVSIRRTRRKRAPRKSTRFAIAHPAPQLRTKQRMLVQIRPRLLLQLQQVGDRRAIPAFDVVPSSLVAGTIIIPRLAKRFPRMLGAKPELGQNDVLVVRSDDYGPSTPGSSPATDDAGDSLDDRDVVAVIGALPQSNDCAEIVLEDGATWVAVLMANGSYEFRQIDDQGRTTTARWVRRSLASTRDSSASLDAFHTSTSSRPPEYKWTFSLIDPSLKRHPIMGSLTSDSVEIYDTYSTLSTSSRRYPPSRSFGPDVNAGFGEPVTAAAPRKEERVTVAVTQEQRMVMIATAAWISLHQQGWPASANPKFTRSTMSSQRRCASTGAPSRRQTFPAYDWDGSRAASPLSFSPHTPDSSVEPPAVNHRHSTAVPARAMSTGREFMRRRSGRRESGVAVGRRLSGIAQHSMEKQTREEEEKAHTCRPRFRQWLQRLFRRMKGPEKGGELAKYKLQE